MHPPTVPGHGISGHGILGHGIDLVEVARIADLTARHGDRFLRRVFTADELAYAQCRPKRRFEHLAARFAAKEAVVKVLGTGRRFGIAWHEIEVVREPTGRPTVALHGAAAEQADRAGVRQWHLSLSHVATHATASAIGCG